MASSTVAIANRALSMLGARRIESLTQDHSNARTMNAAYIPLRNKLMRQYAWNFAIKRASIAADATKTVYGELNRFPKPNDYVRLLRDAQTSGTFPGTGTGTNRSGILDIRHDWQIEGLFIVTADAAPLKFRYLAAIEDPTLHDPLFDEALAALMAWQTCDEVTQSNTKKTLLKDDYEDTIALARRSNAFENDADVPLEDDWNLVRL